MQHSCRREFSWFGVLVVCAGTALAAETNTHIVVRSETDRLLDQASLLFNSKRAEEAIALATQAIETKTNDLRGWSVRGWFYSETGQPAKAVADFSEVMRINPANAPAWRLRGLESFKLGRFAESLADLDKYCQLAPREAAQCWPRGIAAFHAGKYDVALDQFEQYRQRDTNDVEVAVWMFLCVAKQRGLERARMSLPRVEKDPRVPMMEIHRMFAGTTDPAEVLRVASIDTAVPPENPAEKLNRQLFNAHFYVGLYDEARGRLREACDHVLQAALIYRVPDFMGDLARVHGDVLRGELDKSAGKPVPDP